MATVIKTSSGKWRFIVTHNYKQLSGTFDTKAEGYAWENEIKRGIHKKQSNINFGQLLEEYRDKVSIKKKGERWERIRIEKFLKYPITKIKLSDLTKRDFADWRDRRLQEVSALSVLREWALLNHCLHVAVNDWEYLENNPMKGLEKPKAPPSRDRLVTNDEFSRLCFALNYAPDAQLTTITSRVGAAFVFAIETAMRAQEICNLRWDNIQGQKAKINQSKTYTGIRFVPLSTKAMEIINQCKGVDEELVFGIMPSQLDSIFRKAKKNALIDGLHFHDTRATAITNLAKKVDILDLARIVGHKDLKMLMVYYRESIDDIAKKLG